MNENPTVAATRPRHPGRFLVLAGLVVAFSGPFLYALQLKLGILSSPWYVPLLGLLGGVFVLLALARQRGILRFVSLFLVLGLTGLEIFFLGVVSRLPPYSGPVAVGKPFPTFVTKRADGSSFTQADLTGDKNTILLFFRGRW